MSNNFYNKYGVNIKNESMFFHNHHKISWDSKMMAISAFTSSDYLLRLIYRLKGFKFERLDNKKFVMNYEDESIKFKKISDSFEVKSKLSNSEKKILLNRKLRYGQCHNKSMEFINCADYIVTGYVNNFTIHSWLECGDKVMDYTENLIVDKETYYKLMNVRVLSCISRDDVLTDANSKFLRTFSSVKFYLLFRDEIVREGLNDFDQDVLVKKR